MRASGILYPISSLASRYGIGCFSREAYDFVDFLEEAGQTYWQILPVGPTGFGDSPYQPFSAFAGNPYFICLETLIEEGLLRWEECNNRDFGNDPERVDYGAQYNNRFEVLKIAFGRFVERNGLNDEKYLAFKEKENSWLADYALFMALKQKHEGKSWLDWEDCYRKRNKKALAEASVELKDTIDFFCFQQFKFAEQWDKLHEYANKKHVKFIGDIPFYVSMDSTDSWAHPEAFQFDKNFVPTVVAGCPPDAFSATGQLWGNPIYNWKKLKKDNYAWWIARIKRSYDLYDVLRVDHFHGFAEYYAIPYGDTDALNGTQEKGPGIDFFNSVKEQLGDIDMIAEDLGVNTPEKEQLLLDSGFPGMKVLQFAFTSWNSVYVNHRHIQNCVVYTGTHDNPTTRAWIEEISEGNRSYVRKYINSMNTDYGAFTWDMIREAYRSVADTCIVPLQDYLVKGNEARLNCPGRPDGNWQWRLKPNFLSKELAKSIREMTDLYGRIPDYSEEEAVEE